MNEKKRYIVQKVLCDSLFPDILSRVKDTEGRFSVLVEDYQSAQYIADKLNQQDKRIKELEDKLASLMEG